MKIINTKFQGLKVIQQKRFSDKRGSLRETYRKKIVKWDDLIFDFATTSKKNAFRGFHFQYKNQQAKYVSVLKGKILDCVIDLRKNSRTFGESFLITLSEKNCKALYIPKGFAHGYYSYDNLNIIYYKLSDYYNPKVEDGIIWNNKSSNLEKILKKPLISKKDKKLKTLLEFKKAYTGL